MKIFEHLHGFLWNDPRVNNCNTYLIDGPPRVGKQNVQANFKAVEEYWFN